MLIGARSSIRNRELQRNAMAAPIPNPEIAFLMAASEGNLMILKRLASKAGNGRFLEKAYETVAEPSGKNALHLAAAAGNTRVCKFLVDELNYNRDSRDDLGNTPLLLAIQEENHPVAIYLIERGAGIECANNSGYTALNCAADLGLKEILRLLLSKGAKLVPDKASCTPLQSACSHGKEDSVKIFLDHGAHPNATSKNHFTPLMLSILADSYECLELLLEAGADPNIALSGKTPLILAAFKGGVKTLSRLLKAGANPNVIEPHRLMTPIEIAASNGKVPAVIILFPYTSWISFFPDWSVMGIMKDLNSEAAKAQREIRRKEHFELSKATGQEAFERKDYEDAVHWYTQAMGADPKDAVVLSNRSLCWVMLNRAERALEDAKACVALKPDWPKTHYREGSAWMLFHEYRKASEAFSKALKLDPNNKEIKKAHREAVGAVNEMLRHE